MVSATIHLLEMVPQEEALRFDQELVSPTLVEVYFCPPVSENLIIWAYCLHADGELAQLEFVI